MQDIIYYFYIFLKYIKIPFSINYLHVSSFYYLYLSHKYIKIPFSVNCLLVSSFLFPAFYIFISWNNTDSFYNKKALFLNCYSKNIIFII